MFAEPLTKLFLQIAQRGELKKFNFFRTIEVAGANRHRYSLKIQTFILIHMKGKRTMHVSSVPFVHIYIGILK